MKTQLGSQKLSGPVASLAVLVVLALSAFQAASVLGLHVHVLPNGRVVVHSHPMDRDASGRSTHQHTEHDFAVLNAVGKVLQTDFPHFCVSTSPEFEASFQVVTSAEPVVVATVTTSAHKRSPPAVSSL
ncbi:hypothetical protein GF420_02565 [candidate division GN15 bacterium]|nr:hypothetical protein [candidate division GN15 bacterium]